MSKFYTYVSVSGGRTLPANRPEQALAAGGGRRDGSEAWRWGSLSLARDHTTRQHAPLLIFSLSLHLFISTSFPLNIRGNSKWGCSIEFSYSECWSAHRPPRIHSAKTSKSDTLSVCTRVCVCSGWDCLAVTSTEPMMQGLCGCFSWLSAQDTHLCAAARTHTQRWQVEVNRAELY